MIFGTFCMHKGEHRKKLDHSTLSRLIVAQKYLLSALVILSVVALSLGISSSSVLAQVGGGDTPALGGGGSVANLAGDIYRGGPYADIATYKMYEEKERGSQTLASLGMGLGSTARDFPSRSGKVPGDSSSGGGAGQDTENANLSFTASQYENYKVETGPYRETMAKLDSPQMLSMYNELSNYSRVTQAAIACSLANSAVCHGKNSALQYAISHGQFGLQQFARLKDEIKDTDMARELTACLKDAAGRFPGSSLDDLMAVCSGDRLGQAGTAAQARVPIDGSFKPLTYNRNGSANGGAGVPGSGPGATQSQVNTEYLSNRIYQPVVDLLQAQPERGREWGWTADIVRRFKLDFIKYYGDLEFKVQETSGGATGVAPVLKTQSVTRIAPKTEGANSSEVDSIEVLRRKVAQRVVMALLDEGDQSPTRIGQDVLEETLPGLIIEQCKLVNTLPGPFVDGGTTPSNSGTVGLTDNSRVAEYCRPKDKSHFYRNSALHVGDYKFTSDHCRTAWWLAQKWLDSLGEAKGGYTVQSSNSQAKRYNCELLVEMGKKLREQQRTGEKTNAITFSGNTGKVSPKPEIAQFIDYWAAARSYYNSEYDLPNAILKHIGVILTASQHPQDKELYDQAKNLIESMHVNIRAEVAERIAGFQETMGKLVPEVKKDRSGGSVTVMNYGSNMSSTNGSSNGAAR